LPSQRLACQVSEFDFSAHAPRELLFDYIRKISPKIVILVHGDPPAVSWFNSRIAKELPGVQAVIPEPGKEYQF
jgi:Cft2 family RNA processing exonuclease